MNEVWIKPVISPPTISNVGFCLFSLFACLFLPFSLSVFCCFVVVLVVVAANVVVIVVVAVLVPLVLL